jgi:hypothetical protein
MAEAVADRPADAKPWAPLLTFRRGPKWVLTVTFRDIWATAMGRSLKVRQWPAASEVERFEQK